MNAETCLVCGGSYGRSGIAGLLECSRCRFVTADLALSREELEALYTSEYFSGQEYKDYVAERKLIEKHFCIRLKRLLRYVEEPGRKRLFEIGAAYGFFLSVARDHFAAVEGIDISQDAAAHAADKLGLPVQAGEFLDYEFRDRVDVVCLWDTVEHLARPHLYLEKTARHMNPGGVLAVTTGDIGSLVARFRGARWRQIHPPTHLHYFSKRTLARLLENYGFQVRYCGYDGMYRSVDTIAYILLNIKHHRPGLYAALKRVGMLDWSLYLNLYDTVFMVAQKR